MNDSVNKTTLEELAVATELNEHRRLSKICRLIEALARIKSTNNIFNQYSYELDINSIRRDNLFLYFQKMTKFKPRILLVGEAPGYQGCRLTGVPFTSEYILLKGLEELGLFGESRGYRKTHRAERLCKEPSASIVWQTLTTHFPVPLIWNAFPFHPFKLGNEQSNRKPNKEEMKIGQSFLNELIQIFDIEIIVAVGNTAEATLKNMEIRYQKVRHPANGGKTLFVNGMKTVMDTI